VKWRGKSSPSRRAICGSDKPRSKQERVREEFLPQVESEVARFIRLPSSRVVRIREMIASPPLAEKQNSAYRCTEIICRDKRISNQKNNFVNQSPKKYRWNFVTEPEQGLQITLESELNITPSLSTVLINRGITSYDLAKQFFRPTFADMHDPFLMEGMEIAVQRLRSALENKEKILIFGDYDVDGTNSTAMMYLFLQSLNADVSYYVPDRIVEGYGVSLSGIRKGKELGTTLLITVDCGVTAIEQIEFARELGIDVIICDHHRPGEQLPNALALLDPLKEGCSYPFKYLCGCGVAFKLIHGILLRLHTDINKVEEILKEYLQFVVLATAADIVPITGENRVFMKLGLELLNRSPRTGIRTLIQTAGLKSKKLTIAQIVFVLAPRINAVGRMGDAHRAIHLLTSNDEQEANELASVLEKENTARRKVDEETFLEAQVIAEELLNLDNPAALVLHQEHWHPGVIGIVASRIVEKYYRPTVMLTTIDGKVKGSARSVDGFDIYTALSSVEEKLLQFGGHKYAAGVLLESERVGEFRDAFSKSVGDLMTDELRTPRLTIDCELPLSELTPRFMRIIEQFSPYGPQNSRPTFIAKNVIVWGAPRIVGKGHLRFKVRESMENGSAVYDAIAFGLGERITEVRHTATIDIVFSLDDFSETIPASNGNQQLPQLRVKDVRAVEQGS